MFILKMYLIFGVILDLIFVITINVVNLIMKKIGKENYSKVGWILLTRGYESIKDFIPIVILLILNCLIWPIFIIMTIAVLQIYAISYMCYNKKNLKELKTDFKKLKNELLCEIVVTRL